MKPLTLVAAVIMASMGIALAAYPQYTYMPVGYGGYGYPGGSSDFLGGNGLFIVLIFFFLTMMMMTTTSTTNGNGPITVSPTPGGNVPPIGK